MNLPKEWHRYLDRGLASLAISDRNIWDGHFGAAVIAGCSFVHENLPVLSSETINSIGRNLDEFVASNQSYFASVDSSELHPKGVAPILSALDLNVDRLCEIGHNVIYSAWALWALRQRSDCATRFVVNGVAQLIVAFGNATPGYFVIDGTKSTPADLPPIVTDFNDSIAGPQFAAWIAERVLEFDRVNDADMQVGHLVTHGHAVSILANLGYDRLAERARAVLKRRVRLMRATIPAITPIPAVASDNSIGLGLDSFCPEYWHRNWSEHQWHHGHAFKYPASGAAIAAQVEDAELRRNFAQRMNALL